MTTLHNDYEMQQTILKLKEKLTQLSSLKKLNSQELEILINSFGQLSATLKTQLNNYSDKEFSYEFYREASGVIEQITQFRLANELRSLLKENNIIDRFNNLVETIRSAVYRHPSLGSSHAIQKPEAKEPIEIAQMIARMATQQAAAAAADADKANEIGVEFIEKIQAAQMKNKEVPQELLDQSFAHTLIIYAKNAASVLALDDAAVALANLNDAIEQQKVHKQ